MKVTEVTRGRLAYIRDQKKMLAAGYEYVQEPIRQIVRGDRWRHKIVDVKIAAGGKDLWVKISKDKST